MRGIMTGLVRRLRALWNAPAASPAPPKRVWRDWLLLVLVPIFAVFEVLVRSGIPALVPSLIVTLAVLPTLLWRRTYPLLMLVISFAITEAFRIVYGDELQLLASVFLLLVIYSVFRWGSGRAIVVGLAIMIASTIASALTPPFDPSELIGGFAFVAVIGLLGLLLRVRAGNRMRELDRAKSNEREELARDLHDTVAHHVSAIAIQAQAGLATVETNPDAATAALRVIEAEASRTLTEMRTMVRVLRRDDSAELAPADKIGDLRRLASGDVSVEVSGDSDGLPAPVAAALYRIAQESVTNARRHARGATRIDVKVSIAGERVRLTVHDDGAAGPAGEPGYGITGMIERAALLGGTCSAGRDPEGGWTVTAELPVMGAR
jgi:signal transduction histidine kinase